MNQTMILAAILLLGACSSGRLEILAVGARVHHSSPTTCTIEDNAGGALAALPDQPRDGKGLNYEAVKTGTARIKCADGNNGHKVEVREPASIALARSDGGKAPVKVGSYAPTICVVARDKSGKELQLGTLVEGVELAYTDQVSRVVDHGMGGLGNPACGDQQMAGSEGTVAVSATWKGMKATTTFEVKGKL